jgi:hypothetical protein
VEKPYKANDGIEIDGERGEDVSAERITFLWKHSRARKSTGLLCAASVNKSAKYWLCPQYRCEYSIGNFDPLYLHLWRGTAPHSKFSASGISTELAGRRGSIASFGQGLIYIDFFGAPNDRTKSIGIIFHSLDGFFPGFIGTHRKKARTIEFTILVNPDARSVQNADHFISAVIS